MESTATPLQALLHPVRSLPDDVLMEIFEWCSPCLSSKKGPHRCRSEIRVCDSLNHNRHPWVLSQVSRRWRIIALSQPSLWASIHLPLPMYALYPPENLLRRLGLMLQRSKSYPLSLAVKEDGNDCGVMPLLLAETGRWKSLHANATSAFFRPLSDLSFPALTHATIFLRTSHRWVIPFTAFRRASRLSSFDMCGVPSSKVELPWSQLRVVTIRGHGPISLNRLRAVEVLEICATSSHRLTLSATTLPLSFLHTLRLCALRDWPHAARLMSRNSVPRLATLCIHISKEDHENIRIPSDVPDSLRRLSLTAESALSCERFVRLLRSVENVEVLNLGDGILPRAALDNLLVTSGDPLLPRLKSFRIGWGSFRRDQAGIFKMAKSRQDGVSCAVLEEVQVIGYWGGKRDWASLKMNREKRGGEWEEIPSLRVKFVDYNDF